MAPSVGFASEFEDRGRPLRSADSLAMKRRDDDNSEKSDRESNTEEEEEAEEEMPLEVHEVVWCNSPRWSNHLYTCREL